MREGQLYKHIIGNSELKPSLKVVFKAWLDSAVEEFPHPGENQDLSPSDLDRKILDWFNRYFIQACSEKATEK